MPLHLHQNFKEVRGADGWMPDSASSYDRAKTNRTGYIIAMCVYHWKCLIKYIFVCKISARISGSTGRYYFI